MQYKKLLGKFAESNTFILEKKGNKSAFLVDAGAGVLEIKQALGKKKLSGILLTHGHFDHINNLKEILNEFGFDLPIYLHDECRQKLFDANKNLSTLFGKEFALEQDMAYNFVILKDKSKIEVLEEQVEVFNFKGHSNCSLAFLFEKLFVVGDVVFESGVGRHDLEEGGLEDTIKTLERLSEIAGYETVLSGHGKESLYDRQQRNINAWLQYLKRNV